MEAVYKWCAELESLRKELKTTGATERVTMVRVEDADALMSACAKVGATCVKTGPTEQVKVPHHGGSYHVEKQPLRITFQ